MMNETKELLRRGGEGFAPSEGVMDSLIRRRARKQRNRRIGAAVLALSVALLTFAALIRTFRTVERPADEPTPVPTPSGIFADVGGWIVYGNGRVKQGPLGIWAVDPTRPSGGQFGPVFSPDGTKIAYLELYAPRSVDEASLSLRVVNADGTGVRVLHDVGYPQKLSGPAWSPDGTHIAYSGGNVLWVVSADCSGITSMLGGRSPYWSPDGSRIAFELPQSRGRGLAIADVDGTNVQTFGHGAHAGPWNPLLPAMPGEPNPAATGSGLAAPFVYAIVLLGVVGVLVLAWRARRNTGAS
jgi:WD40-like Beta Propeller Repeat